MTETILKSIMRLFAIVTQVHSIYQVEAARSVVENYLKSLVRPDKVRQYLIMFDFYHTSLREREIKTGEKQLSLFSVKVIIICEQINEVLTKKQKIHVLAQLFEILTLRDDITDHDIDILKTISSALKFNDLIFESCFQFVLNNYRKIPLSEDVLVLDGSNDFPIEGHKHLYHEFIKGKLVFLHIASSDTYLFRQIEEDSQINYNGELIGLHKTYILEKGSVLKNPLIGNIYYSDILRVYLQSRLTKKISFAVEEASYKFEDGVIGIHPFNLYEESGQLIGIMGGSGVGKSTLLNLLNGDLKPSQGRVLVNGYDVHRDASHLKGVIGFIPQDDLLIEELTVFQNLYFNAKLCFKSYSEEKIHHRVNQVLSDLDLAHVQHLKVGSPLNKYISGGQRKRLNIALELIREPFVLFVDEPTSGLSSNDSEKVIDLLKEQSLKGRLVVINIHQPSSDIYKQFDKLLVMDKGGRMVFHGNPLDAMLYLKMHNQLINAEDGECPTCGNVNPEQALQIIESKKVDEYGDLSKERMVDADEWYQSYKKSQEQELKLGADVKLDLPENDFEVPSRKKQFRIFYLRNFISKITDRQYLLINLTEAPALALILSWFTKYKAGLPDDPDAYVFSENMNLPVYIFMSVIVALFLGMIVSAEEIIKDRKIIKRESFLNLNRLSYYNSKVAYLVCVSAIQATLFVLVGNSIMQIKGMLGAYWLIYLLASITANLIGLIVSANLKTVVSIYILIPLLLVPQLLLGGAMIKFDKLNSHITHEEYVPVIGDLMPSRWAYEALAVQQFKGNRYQRHFYDIEQAESQASYVSNYYVHYLQDVLNGIERNIINNKNLAGVEKDLNMLKEEAALLGSQYKSLPFELGELSLGSFNLTTAKKFKVYLEEARQWHSRQIDKALKQKDEQIASIRSQMEGQGDFLKFYMAHYNQALADIVLNKNETQMYQRSGTRVVRKAEPVYQYPTSRIGRAHFFAPVKRIAGFFIDTFWYNALVLLLIIFVLYLILVNELIKKIKRWVVLLHINERLRRYTSIFKRNELKDALNGFL